MQFDRDIRRIAFGIAWLLLAAPVVVIATAMSLAVLISAPIRSAEVISMFRENYLR